MRAPIVYPENIITLGTTVRGHVMNKCTALFLVLLLGISFVDPAEAHVDLVYPDGGETFSAGDVVTVEWQIVIPHDQQNWDLYFSPDGGETWRPIVEDLPVEQVTYEWTVPGASTMRGQIRVIQDNTGANYEDRSDDFTVSGSPMDVERREDVPVASGLISSFPNPFSATTTLEFSAARTEHVTLDVFDLQGRPVAHLVDQTLAAGTYRVDWPATGQASGVYLCRIQVGEAVDTRTLLLAR